MPGPGDGPLGLALATLRLRLALPGELDRRPLDELLRSLTPPGAPRRARPSPDEERRIYRWTERILRRRGPLLRTRCLVRALIRYALLREVGVAARFVMGVRERRGELTGHAWVELGGDVAFETLAHPYRRTFAFPPDGADPSLFSESIPLGKRGQRG